MLQSDTILILFQGSGKSMSSFFSDFSLLDKISRTPKRTAIVLNARVLNKFFLVLFLSRTKTQV